MAGFESGHLRHQSAMVSGSKEDSSFHFIPLGGILLLLTGWILYPLLARCRAEASGVCWAYSVLTRVMHPSYIKRGQRVLPACPRLCYNTCKANPSLWCAFFCFAFIGCRRWGLFLLLRDIGNTRTMALAVVNCLTPFFLFAPECLQCGHS